MDTASGTRFSRVTVVGTGRRLDVSLPVEARIIELLPVVLRMLSIPADSTSTGWQLAAPEFGTLDPFRSLDDVGVLDGALLYLARPETAPPPPYVDDVESETAEVVSTEALEWTGSARRNALGALLAVVLLAIVCCGWTAQAPVSWIAPIVVVLCASVAGRWIREPSGWLSTLAVVPAAVGLLITFTRPEWTWLSTTDDLPNSPTSSGLSAAVGIVVGLAVLLAGSVRRSWPVATAGAVTSACCVAALVAMVGLGSAPSSERAASLALVVALVLCGSAGRLAVGGAALVELMVSDERGRPVSRQAIRTAVRRGLGLTTGVLWAGAAMGATASAVLVASPVIPTAPVVGVLGGLAVGLRSRMFSRAAHVAPMVAVPVITAVVAAFRASAWWGAGASWITLLFLTGCLLGIGCGWARLPEVAAARLHRALDRLESIVVLALIPSLVVLWRVIPAVLGWWR